MKRQFFILLSCVIVCAVSSCKTTSTDTPTTPPVENPRTDISIVISNIKPPRTGEFFLLWLKYTNDPSWHLFDTLTINYIDQKGAWSSIFHHRNIASLDTLSEAIVTIEQTLAPSAPGLPILHGVFLRTDLHNSLATIAPTPLGDFSSLSSTIVFTTTNAQSVNDSEFYLCNFNGASYEPSLLNLPALPNGWRYGLWAIDSSFYPTQRIFYGLFTQARGHDSDSTTDNLPYPGGAKPVAMNQRSGKIVVSLEPNWYSRQTLVALGKCQLTVLEFTRQLYLTRDSNYSMTNVSSGLPSGSITATRQ